MAAAKPTRSLRAGVACAAGLLLTTAACAPHIARDELAARIEAGSAPTVVDVRSEAEYAEGHVPGAVHVPFYAMLARTGELPEGTEDEPLVVTCEHGPRAGLARAQLWLAGAGEVRFLEGHMSAWKRDGLPLSTEPR